jgi:hypothetical protein
VRLVWYALGGGLGHLQRALAVLRYLTPHLKGEAPLLLTSSGYAHLALAQGVPCVRLPGAHESGAWPEGVGAALLTGVLAAAAPIDCLVVDTFPDGLHLELTPDILMDAKRRFLIARPGGGTPDTSPGWASYDGVFVPLPESPWPGAEPVGWMLACGPADALSPEDARRRLRLPALASRPLVMAVHAGDPGEIVNLFEGVREASARVTQPHDLRFATPLPVAPWFDDERLVHPWPAAELFSAVDVLVSGGGYHSSAEASAFGLRAIQQPFRRTHDDQAARVGAGPWVAQPHWGVSEWAQALETALSAPAPAPAPPEQMSGAQTLALSLAARLP